MTFIKSKKNKSNLIFSLFYIAWLVFSTKNVLNSDLIMNLFNTYLTICVVWERVFGLKCGLIEFIKRNLSLISIYISKIINAYLLKPVLSPNLSLEFLYVVNNCYFLVKFFYLLLVLKLMVNKSFKTDIYCYQHPCLRK